MKATPLTIPDVIVLEPRIYDDERGFFFESFNQKAFDLVTGLTTKFVQDNHSRSVRGVLRGLHYQLAPKTQGKLIRVIEGEVFDVAVDMREYSPTCGQWAGEYLTADNKKQLWIPEGFAHGFLTLSSSAELLYKTTDYYAPELERVIQWDDPDISIKWPCETKPALSEKDRSNCVLLKDAVLL